MVKLCLYNFQICSQNKKRQTFLSSRTIVANHFLLFFQKRNLKGQHPVSRQWCKETGMSVCLTSFQVWYSSKQSKLSRPVDFLWNCYGIIQQSTGHLDDTK